MQLIIKKQIGKRPYTFTFEGNNLFEMVNYSQKLSFPDVPKCGLCESDNLYLNARTPQEFKYVEIKCGKCKGRVSFGNMKNDPDTFYLKKNEDKSLKWEAYEKQKK